MTPWLAGLVLLGAWDDFEASRPLPTRAPSQREVAEAFDEVEKSIAAWQAERAAFKQAQRELAVWRDVRDLRAVPFPQVKPEPVEVVKNPGFEGGRSKVLERRGGKRSPADEALQAELDAAEARALDYRLRCADDPAACSRGAQDKRRVEAGNEAFDEAARQRQAELDRREQELARRQQELEAQQKAMEEEAQKLKKAVDARRKATESQARENDAALRGIVDALSDE